MPASVTTNRAVETATIASRSSTIAATATSASTERASVSAFAAMSRTTQAMPGNRIAAIVAPPTTVHKMNDNEIRISRSFDRRQDAR